MGSKTQLDRRSKFYPVSHSTVRQLRFPRTARGELVDSKGKEKDVERLMTCFDQLILVLKCHTAPQKKCKYCT